MRTSKRIILAALAGHAVAAALLCPSEWPGTFPAMAADAPVNYPQTRRTDHRDVYHGTEVADPYRWLETDVRQSKEVAAWVAAQNKVTFDYLSSIAQREQIRARLTKIWNYERYSPPFKVGPRYYFLKNDGLQNQSVLYTMDSLDDEPRVLIDPNTWSKDGTVALAGTACSEDGKYVAYGIADAGSDWKTWRVKEIESGSVLDDELKWIKFSDVAWTKDGQGFFYGRYDEPKEGQEFQDLNLNQKLFYHRLGTPQSDDVLVYSRPDQPTWGFEPAVTEDGRYLVITIWKGTDDKYRVVVKDLTQPQGTPVDVIDNFQNEYTFVGNEGPLFFFKTDLDAPRRRLIAIDIRKPQRQDFKEIIPQAKEKLESIEFIAKMFLASYLKDAKTQVKIFTTEGKLVRELDFPAIGSAYGFRGRSTDKETFYAFSSFTIPPSVYHYDMTNGKSMLMHRAEVDVSPDDYEVIQVFYRSKDGTQVPMFLAHRKGLKRDGSNPTLLYGYGGFNISLVPQFSASRMVWLEMGGVFAMPNLRGGGEYGEAWHEAGTKLNKQNVFDDFIAAAEWLIDNGYTRPEKLAIQGRSNGGLLVGAVMTQRPELFAACLPAVGVMDMLRFDKFTAGRFWVDDYGSSDDPQQFNALLAYSPYHNIKPGVAYPATLITTADTDDRVVPGHSFKFAAAIQHAQSGAAPTLIRIETRAGHGSGKPTDKIIQEVADQWAFLVKNLKLQLPPDVYANLILEKDDGYRGIWYYNQPQPDQYVYKYSGGLGTYCAKHRPLAVYAKQADKTFFCYGGALKDSNTLLHMVSYYDHATGLVPRPVVLLNKQTSDAHDNPVISLDEKGHIWIFSSSHGTARPSYILGSKEPYSIDAFEHVLTTNFSYPQPYYVPGRGFLFLHTKYGQGRRLYQMTSPDGRTWTEPELLAAIEMGHYQVSWRDGDRIGTAFNFHPEGKGVNWRTNLYYIETDDFGRTWHNAQGEQLELPLTTPDNAAIVHDYQAEKLNVYLKDLAFDSRQKPVILYLTSGGWESGPKNDPRTWRTARWTGTEWEINGSIVSDNNYDTGSLYIESDGLWRIIGPTETGPQPYNTGGEVAIWTSTDQGRTWTMVRQLTRHSRFNHSYCRKPLNAHPDFYALWADGHGRQPSESRLYFCDKSGEHVRLLPPVMKEDFVRPKAPPCAKRENQRLPRNSVVP